jgi:hypothetical protein
MQRYETTHTLVPNIFRISNLYVIVFHAYYD